MTRSNHQIQEDPNHRIYGFAYQKSAIDFLHIESLSDTRRKSDWTIRPHQHSDLTQFFFIEQGGGTIRIDDKATDITAPSIIIIPTNETHTFDMRKDIAGHLITIADSFLHDLATLVREPLIENRWRQVLHISVSKPIYQSTGINELISNLTIEFNARHEARTAAIYAHISLILTSIIRVLTDNPSQHLPSSDNKNLEVLRQFQNLCDLRYADSKTVSDYCKDLQVTERTLRRITQQYLGIPPLQLIHDRILLEAQRNLIYSSASVSSIAESLGFDDPAYFTRFFKRNTQQTPNQFRTSKWQIPI